MKFHVLTLFPEMLEHAFHTSITGRAAQNGSISLHAVNIRDYTQNRHNKVDDYPYGGGAGMLMQAQPVFDACQAVLGEIRQRSAEKAVRVVYVTPQGTPFRQEMAQELAGEEELIFLCGHYEGIDERVLEEVVTDYVSIGDYVLTGGELPALVMIDAIARLVPEVLHNETSAETESFHKDLLEYPQYSRPEAWHDKKVPPVLLSGDHQKIGAWRLEQSILRTRERRPDLYAEYQKTMQAAEALEKRDKLLYMDMIAPLREGSAKLLRADENGILLLEKKSGDYMLAAAGDKGGKVLLQSLAGGAELPEGGMLVLHQEAVKNQALDAGSFTRCSECLQAVYTRGVSLPVSGDIAIRPLDMSHVPAVCAHYWMGPSYVEERIREHAMHGAFVGEELAGFIGIHAEGCMGMLEVLEKYRRRGIGEALEADCINRLLRAGRIPFCQAFEDNEASLQLQRKLGLRISSGKMWWLQK